MDKLGRRRVITERDSDVPYLVRYYVFLKDRKNFPFNITLHKVLVSDEPVLHDHPWSYATFIIKGGYWENTPDGRFWRGNISSRSRTNNGNIINTHNQIIYLTPKVQMFLCTPQLNRIEFEIIFITFKEP